MSKNGSFPNTSPPSTSSSTSKLFSRTGSIFQRNRKEKVNAGVGSVAVPQTQAQESRPASRGNALNNISASVVENTARPPLAHAASTHSDPSIASTGQTDTSQTSKSEHTRVPSDTSTSQSIPAPLIPNRTSSKSSKRAHRHSHSATNIDLGNLRRSISLRSVTSPHKHSFHHARGTSNSSSTENATSPPLQHQSSKPLLHIPAFAKRQKSADALSSLSFASETSSPIERSNSHTNFPLQPSGMSSVASSYRSGQVSSTTGRPPAQSISSVGAGSAYSQSTNGISSMAMQPPPQGGAAGGQTPQMVYQHIMDTASKRISTLDYLRKAHEGRVYWFNTLLFTKPDLLKFSYFQPAKLARRATNYLLLGFSLPTILDLNSQTPTEYLKALNALLVEFEQYQQLHPPDGSIPSSLSRARVPQMFKRSGGMGMGKSRRQSSATDFSSTLSSTPESGTSSSYTFPSSSTTSLPTGSETLLPQENYTHLLTPSLPFDPDFFETFATLCDVLIDCYTKVTQLIRGPEMCGGNVGEMFGKADARVRKVIVAGVVREFEERCREGVRSEVAGVGKVVLGGLM